MLFCLGVVAKESFAVEVCVFAVPVDSPLGLLGQGVSTDWILTLAKLDQNLLATGSQDCSVLVWSLSTSGKLLFNLTGHSRWVITMVKLEDNLLASRSFFEMIIWNVTSGTQKFSQSLGYSVAYPAMANLKSNLLAVANTFSYNSIEIWNVTSESVLSTVTGDYRSIVQLASLDYSLLASGGIGPSVCVWNVTSGELKYLLKYEDNSFLAALNENLLASAKGFTYSFGV